MYVCIIVTILTDSRNKWSQLCTGPQGNGLFPMIWRLFGDCALPGDENCLKLHNVIEHLVSLCSCCCLQGQLCGLCLLIWPSGKMRMIHRINENHYKYNDLHVSVSFGLGPLKRQDLIFMWFSLILSNSWFSVILGNSQISLKLILIDSWWFSMILCYLQISLKLILSDSWWFSVILGDSQESLKLILNDSQWFLMIFGDSQISLKLILIDSWWFSMNLK